MITAAEHWESRRLRPESGRPLWRGWAGLLLGLGLFWLLTWVVLPWGQGLPVLEPVMSAISAADVESTNYWYSQSEETAGAENYLRNTLRR